MLERERPYTHEEVKTLYPVLTEVEARMVAHIEQHHTNPQWQVWPHADYPQVHLWLARRSFTPMPPLVVRELGGMPGEIRFWQNEYTSHATPWGSSST